MNSEYQIQTSFDGCYEYFKNGHLQRYTLGIIAGVINSSVKESTTLEEIEAFVSRTFQGHTLSQTSRCFKFSLLNRAIELCNKPLVCQIVEKEGRDILKPWGDSVMSSLYGCKDVFKRFAMTLSLINLGVDVHEKYVPLNAPIIELFYNSAKTEVLFLLMTQGVAPVSSINPPNCHMQTALEMATKAHNCLHLLFGFSDEKSNIKVLDKDIVYLICSLVAKMTIFKEIVPKEELEDVNYIYIL